MAPNQNCNCLAISGFCCGGFLGSLAAAAIGAAVVMGRISEMVVKFQDHIDEGNAGTCDLSTIMGDETRCVAIEAKAPKVENDDIRGEGYYCAFEGNIMFGPRRYSCPCDVTRSGTGMGFPGDGIQMAFYPDPDQPQISNDENVWVRDISWTDEEEKLDYDASYACFYTARTDDFEHMFWLGYDKTEVVDEIKSWVEGIESVSTGCFAGGVACLLATIGFCLCGCCVCCKKPPGQPTQGGAQPAIVGQPYGQQPAYAQQQPVYMQQQQPPGYGQQPAYAQPMPGYGQPMPIQGTVVQPVGQMAT